jgi:murein DD-endopeptidase MepM/ murein hydrolase activator NlpD
MATGCLHLGWRPRGIVLALIAFAAAGCSQEPARFDDPRFDATGSVGAQPAYDRAAGGYWSRDGGTAVTVGRGETVYNIARRHHVPVSAIVQANNLGSPNALRLGQQLVIPRFSAAPTPLRPLPSQPDVAALIPPEPIPTAGGGGALVAGGAEPHVPLPHVPVPESRPRVSPPPVAASGKPAIAQSKDKPAPEQRPLKLVEQEPPVARPPAGKPPAAAPPAATSPDRPADVDPIKTEDAAPRFHWPVRGEVVSGFGPKADGQRNDGIDIAVPENTPIKAADDGVVVYSGNQLKSFGNLVLVRHNNEYVTAYAHAKEVRVKPGDTIKAGEVIGTSGQTGNVATPQLHFEIRKGSTPVDPLRLLHGV